MSQLLVYITAYQIVETKSVVFITFMAKQSISLYYTGLISKHLNLGKTPKWGMRKPEY